MYIYIYTCIYIYIHMSIYIYIYIIIYHNPPDIYEALSSERKKTISRFRNVLQHRIHLLLG